MGHPSLGEPPRDETAGYPDAAARLVSEKERIGRRTLEVMLAGDPTLADRLGEDGLTRLYRDTEIFIERLARSIAAADPYFMHEFAEWVAPVYRRRRIPMDDLIALADGLRKTAANVLPPEALASADRALDDAIAAFRRHRRLGGDARRRNKILEWIYKGA